MSVNQHPPPVTGDARLSRFRSTLIFLGQSVIVGLAAAFVVVLFRPDWLPTAENGGQSGGTSSYANAVERSAPAVANIYTRRVESTGSTRRQPGRLQVNTSLGSAVVIDPEGYLVTNYHVIAGASQVRVQLADGRVAQPRLVGFDAETDLAVLKVDMGTLPAIALGRSDRVRIGDVVLAIGNPYGLTKTVTQGIVSATGRGLLGLATFENFIQTDAAINKGNSGGALINTQGELVGINTAVLAQDVATEGISFAIPVNLVRGVVEEIKDHGRVIRGWLGLQPGDLTNAEFETLGLQPGNGIILFDVFQGSPAARAGLRRNDLLLSVNNVPIRNSQQALLIVASLRPGDEVKVTAWRNGETFETTVIAGERPKEVQQR
jgi:serine peptidase DegS